MGSECMIANIPYFVFCYLIVGVWEFGIPEADDSSDSFAAGMSQHDSLTCFGVVSESCAAQGWPLAKHAAELHRQENEPGGHGNPEVKNTLPPFTYKYCKLNTMLKYSHIKTASRMQ